MKSVAIVFAAIIAIASCHVENMKQEPCRAVNFKDKLGEFKQLNHTIKSTEGKFVNRLAPYNTLFVTNISSDATPLTIYGVEFAVKPVFKTLNITGLARLSPHPFTVKSKDKLETGISINGTVVISSKMALEIQQVNKRAWNICWTSILHQSSCPPKVIDVDFSAIITNPSIETTLEVDMLQCSRHASRGTCNDLTVNDLIHALINNKVVTSFVPRLFNRLKSVSIEEDSFRFDEINSLNFKIDQSFHLANELGKVWSKYGIDEINSQTGEIYTSFVTRSQQVIKTHGNKLIQEMLEPHFGNTCYDIKPLKKKKKLE